MSIKEEVNQLSEVYKKLLTEDVGGVSVGIPTGAPNPLDSIGNNDALDDNIPDIQMDDSLDSHSLSSPDNNAQMAKSEVYKLVKSSSELFKMLMDGSCVNVEPWQLSKITKATDYVCSVKNSIEFDEFEKLAGEFSQGMSELNSPVVVKVKDMLAGEPVEVNEEVLKQVIFNIECLKEAQNPKDKNSKDKKTNKHICKFAKKGCKCAGCSACKANKKK